jgi:hypothetical protein
MVDVLASFPNSRVKPRNATTNAQTKRSQVNAEGEVAGTVLDDGGVVTANGNTLVLPPNENQTYINLRNESKTERVYYSYEDKPNMVSGEQENAGSFLEAGEAFDMEAKSGVYCRAEGSSRIFVRIDFGEG